MSLLHILKSHYGNRTFNVQSCVKIHLKYLKQQTGVKPVTVAQCTLWHF